MTSPRKTSSTARECTQTLLEISMTIFQVAFSLWSSSPWCIIFSSQLSTLPVSRQWHVLYWMLHIVYFWVSCWGSKQRYFFHASKVTSEEQLFWGRKISKFLKWKKMIALSLGNVSKVSNLPRHCQFHIACVLLTGLLEFDLDSIEWLSWQPENHLTLIVLL